MHSSTDSLHHNDHSDNWLRSVQLGPVSTATMMHPVMQHRLGISGCATGLSCSRAFCMALTAHGSLSGHAGWHAWQTAWRPAWLCMAVCMTTHGSLLATSWAPACLTYPLWVAVLLTITVLGRHDDSTSLSQLVVPRRARIILRP